MKIKLKLSELTEKQKDEVIKNLMIKIRKLENELSLKTSLDDLMESYRNKVSPPIFYSRGGAKGYDPYGI